MLPTLLALSLLTAPAEPPRATLVGLATLPADTFRPGPTSGQFIDHPAAPFDGRQPVQGISSLTPDPANAGSYLALSDNGFGTKANSADYVLCVYRVTPDFETGEAAWELAFELNDRDEVIDWPTVADGETYPDSDVPVAEAIRAGRLLTGADFDVESLVALPDGTLWLGDEFGPFLLHVAPDGRLLEPPIGLPGEGMHSPDHPTKDSAQAKIPRSAGLEAMWTPAFRPPQRETSPVCVFLEKAIPGERFRFYTAHTRFRFSFDDHSADFDYPLPEGDIAVGAADALKWTEESLLTSVLLIERDDAEADKAIVKQITRFDLAQPLADDRPGSRQFAFRTVVADLLKIADPNDLNGDGSEMFRFDFVTIESLVVVDERTLLLCNDNNYPFGRNRDADEPDGTEFILIRLPEPIAAMGNDEN